MLQLALIAEGFLFRAASKRSVFRRASTAVFVDDGMEWILMEVSQSQSGMHTKKNYPTTSQYGPLSARNEPQSHPLAGQAQACGRLIRRMDRGPDGTC